MLALWSHDRLLQRPLTYRLVDRLLRSMTDWETTAGAEHMFYQISNNEAYDCSIFSANGSLPVLSFVAQDRSDLLCLPHHLLTSHKSLYFPISQRLTFLQLLHRIELSPVHNRKIDAVGLLYHTYNFHSLSRLLAVSLGSGRVILRSTANRVKPKSISVLAAAS